MKLYLWTLLLALCTATLGISAQAGSTPAGTWHSIDEKTGQPRAEIRISEQRGVFTGRIVRSLQATTAGVLEVCDKCPDDRKGKPMVGLDIIRNATRAADADSWDGGEILDPDKGKIYKLQLQMLDGGQKLQVRGYIGPFFKTQIWLRVA
jgi:uncharacterized protein (DUF2147 family)